MQGSSAAPTDRSPRILIIKPSSLGDIVHALPVLAGLRQAYPQAHISWLVGTGFADFLKDHPLIDELILFDRKHYGRMWRSIRALRDFGGFVRRLRKLRFDWVIDLQGLFRSGFLARAAGARRRIGFGHAREGGWVFYNERVRLPGTAMHAVDQNLALARMLSLPVDPPQFPLALSAAERAAAAGRLAGQFGAADCAFIAVLPGARWPSKRWPEEKFAAVIDGIHESGGPPCVMLGAPDERALAERVAAACQAPVVNWVGQTSLRELTALLARARQALCMDSGPMHIAAAVGTPLVSVFGPTNPERTGPYSQVAQVVRLSLPCMPCYRERCPLGHHDCMNKLDPAIVLGEVAGMAGKAARSED